MAEGKGSKGPGDDSTVTKMYETLLAEKEGLIPRGFAEQIEKDVTGAGGMAVARRLALVYLEIPWSESAERVKADRAYAVATAHVAEVLKGYVENYDLLKQWLEAAHTRILVSLSAREDIEAVIADAKNPSADALAHLRLVVDNGRGES